MLQKDQAAIFFDITMFSYFVCKSHYILPDAELPNEKQRLFDDVVFLSWY